MSEFDNFEDDDATEPQESKNPFRARMKELEAEVKSLRASTQEAQQMKRELAMLKAGIPVDDPGSKYFIKGYDGDLTVEAIKNAAIEARLLAPETPPADVAAERQAWQRTAQVATGAQSVSDVTSFETRLRNATNEQEVYEILREAQAAGTDL